MKTKEELMEEMKEDVKVLERYFEGVSIREGEGNTLSVVYEVGNFCTQVISCEYKTFPPKGNLCLCWDNVQGIDYKDFRVSLGNGSFAEDTKELEECLGNSYTHWEDLGINVLDKIKEN